jgi:phage FluMu protein Com
VSSILIFCRDCGKQVASAEARDQLCLDCRVRRSVSDLREEHARLWRKRERYRGKGVNVEQIGHQIGRVEDRMAQRIKEMVSNERQAVEVLRRELEAARGQRYTIKGV